jgi:hypothetical protein
MACGSVAVAQQVTQSRLPVGHIDAEPDVTWGKGGIGDWGWTAWVSTDRLPRAEAEAS